MSGTQWTFLTYLTLYLTGERGFSLARAGLALALAQGLGAVGRLLWGHLSDAHGRRIRILLTMASLALASLALLASDPGSAAIWPLIRSASLRKFVTVFTAWVRRRLDEGLLAALAKLAEMSSGILKK